VIPKALFSINRKQKYSLLSQLRFLFLVWVLVFWRAELSTLNGQNLPNQEDSLKVQEILWQAKGYFNSQKYQKARIYAENAIRLAQQINQKRAFADALFLAGKAAQKEPNFSLATDYLLQSAIEYEILKERNNVISASHQLGNLYFQQELWGNASDYLQQALFLSQKNTSQKLPLSKVTAQLSEAFYQQDDFANALKYDSIRLNYEPNKSEVYQHFIKIKTTQKKYKEAIVYNQKLIEIYKEKKTFLKLAKSYNNAGFLYEKMENSEKAHQAFEQSLAIYQQNAKTKSAPVYLNLGIWAIRQNDYNRATTYFEKALALSSYLTTSELAETYAYAGLNAYLSQRSIQGFEFLEKSIDLAKESNSPEILKDSYLILAELHRKDENFKAYQYYDQLYEKLDDSLKANRAKRQEKLAQIREETLQKESDLKISVANREKQEAELKRLRSEANKRENEIKILSQEAQLKRERLENEQLEKEKVSQLLALAEQKLHLDRQKQEAENQRQKATQQALIAETRRLETQRKAEELEASEAKQKLQAQELLQEKSIRRYGMWILILAVLVLILMIGGFVNARRANRKLEQKNLEIKASQAEIRAQNEELQQNQEEILTQRDFISEQNTELKKNNEHLVTKNQIITEQSIKITASIRYAQTIQKAILPTRQKLLTLVQDYFVLYLPKDVVSGDFYWGAKVDNYDFIAVSDCTGHGVPGAFMSMIGYADLNKIVRERKIIDTVDIMEALHAEIYEDLTQEENQNRDGMDICFCRLQKLDNQTTEVVFTGAKQDLLIFQDEELKIIRGNKRSIGGRQNLQKKFTAHRFVVKNNTTLYLTSDGFTDQNNEARQRFGRKEFYKLITEIGHLPLIEQKNKLNQSLKRHQGKAEQRDDITVLALRV